MNSDARRLRQRLAAIACAGALGLVSLAPQVAGAAGPVVRERPRHVDRDDDWDRGWDSGWDDFNQTLIQMQRESLSSQEEQAREAGRALRRAEVEKQQQKSAAEHEAYFDAILEDSQAALRAPLGVYYRKPGYSTAEPPGSTVQPVEAAGLSFLYDQGIFWLHQAGRYMVVTAPVGAAVDKLPPGVTRIPAKPGPVWYFFGTFFAEKGGAYEVVKPPAGLTVFYLPDGYSQEQVKGAGLYRFGEIFFKPVFIQGVLAYQVVDP